MFNYNTKKKDERSTLNIIKNEESSLNNSNLYHSIVPQIKQELCFKYYFFPTLNTDVFFYSNLKDYFVPIILSEDVDRENTEIVAKSHLCEFKSMSYEMENNVFICWLELWAMCFWYHDEEERKYRFKELLKVIDRLYYPEIEVFNLLFEVIWKYGTYLMVLKLFERLIFLKINPTNSIINIVTRSLEKIKINQKNYKNILNYVIENEDKLEVSYFQKQKFRKRGITKETEWNIFLEE